MQKPNQPRVSGLQVVKAGINTQLQDVGRKGYFYAGVSTSGFMDPVSAYTANRLCGNPAGLALLEIPWGGFQVVSQVSSTIAVTGAETKILLNGRRQNQYASIQITPGDELTITPPTTGIWCYLAIRGGFVTQPVLHSVSGNRREKLGGFSGSGDAIKPGDILPCHSSRQAVSLSAELPDFALWEADTIDLRLLPAGQYSLLSREQRRALFSHQFTVGSEYSRMGFRLKTNGQFLQNLPKITPDAIAYGAVQVPGSGDPIILLNDRQTLGGYCKVGAVISPDCHRLVQCRPGTKIKFSFIRPSIAAQIVRQYWQKIKRIPLRNQ